MYGLADFSYAVHAVSLHFTAYSSIDAAADSPAHNPLHQHLCVLSYMHN